MDNVLIDTDVILDFFFNREPFAEYSTEILTLCQENKINGFTTPVIISNVYYLLKKTAKHNIIVEKIKQLLTIIDSSFAGDKSLKIRYIISKKVAFSFC